MAVFHASFVAKTVVVIRILLKFVFLFTFSGTGDERMAHFNFENIVTDATKLDAPIQRGPLMRWQRKAMETGVRNLSVSDCKFLTTCKTTLVGRCGLLLCVTA